LSWLKHPHFLHPDPLHPGTRAALDPAGPENDGSLVLTAPCVSTATTPLPAYDRGPGRMAGNHYIKARQGG